MEVYEKSYKGLVLWLLGYTAAPVIVKKKKTALANGANTEDEE